MRKGEHIDEAAKTFAKQWQSQMTWLIYEAGGAKEPPEKFNIPKPLG